MSQVHVKVNCGKYPQLHFQEEEEKLLKETGWFKDEEQKTLIQDVL